MSKENLDVLFEPNFSADNFIERFDELSHDELKRKGNECVMAKNFIDAITYYTHVLQKYPKSHTVLSNRSLAYSKLEKFELALKDSNACLQIQPNFARAFYRKSVALYGLKSFKDSMCAAEEGYKLRGSDTISHDCISQWMLSCKMQHHDIVDQTVADFGFELPRQFFVTSANYLQVYTRLFYARLGLTNPDMPFIKSCIDTALSELDYILHLFGHQSTPLGYDWSKALEKISKVNPVESKVASDIASNLFDKSRQFCAWLNTDVDPILFPVTSPIISLILVAVGVYYIHLNGKNINHQITQVACQSVLIFFDTAALLSTDSFIDQQITVYKELLEAFAGYPAKYTVKEVAEIHSYINKTEELIRKCPKDELTNEICDLAMVSIGLARIRLNEDPGLDFTQYAKNSGKAVSKSDNPDELLAFVADREEFVKLLLNNQSDGFELSLETEVLDLLDCIGSLMKLEKVDKAVEIFTLCEMGYIQFFHSQLSKATFSLDEAPSAFNAAQSAITAAMYHFLNQESWLIASIVLRWKCIYSEFRVLLLKLGISQVYLETFKGIQNIKVLVANQDQQKSAYASIADEHTQAVNKVIMETGPTAFLALMRQSYEEVMKKIFPGQILLDYFFLVYKKSYGILVVMEPGNKLSVHPLNAEDITHISEKWAEALAEVDDTESKVLAKQFCTLLIPDSVQSLISSEKVEHIYLCPDWKLTQLPLELLELEDGELLGDKCSITYLSSSRELLREFTLKETYLMMEQEIPFHQSKEGNTCVIVADANYNLKAVEKSESWGNVFTTLIESLFSAPSNKKVPVSPLTNSREEANDIERCLAAAAKEINTCCIMGDEATVFNIVQLDSPTILHFSTHGFTYSEERGVHGNFWADMWTGLVLAGVNTHRLKQFNEVAKEAGTGELTSLAVCGMNLRETKLVYLSTCVSSLGFSTSGEAVNSLAQAFRAAGASTVIATLWEILDEPARKFAIHFYYEVLKPGVRPSSALRYAKNKLREEINTHHIVWSAFVCIGEDIPLFP